MTEIVGPDNVVTRDLESYLVDWTGRFRGSGRIVVRPASADEVARIVLASRRHGVAIVPQGGNTSLVGGSIPMKGEVILSTRRMSRIGTVDPAARQITVGAGAILGDVHRAAAAAGLRYPVDFGARDSATIGGTIATNAGGISVLRYGMTRRHIVGVEAVLGTGDIVSHMNGLVKDNTGYDMAGLLCASEGTLGIVTAARLQLVPAPTHRTTCLVGFDSLAALLASVSVLSRWSEEIDALEMFLDSGAQLVNRTFGRPVPFTAAAYLLIEMSSHCDRDEDLGDTLRTCEGVRELAVAGSDLQRQNLWSLRDEHTPAINSLGPPLKFDVSVPVSDLARFIDDVRSRVESAHPETTMFVFGHAGDGNVHLNVAGVDLSSGIVADIEDEVMNRVGHWGGSVSAEHGIGIAKKRFLTLSRSPAEIAAMKSVKAALDPDGIMNPNVLFA